MRESLVAVAFAVVYSMLGVGGDSQKTPETAVQYFKSDPVEVSGSEHVPVPIPDPLQVEDVTDELRLGDPGYAEQMAKDLSQGVAAQVDLQIAESSVVKQLSEIAKQIADEANVIREIAEETKPKTGVPVGGVWDEMREAMKTDTDRIKSIEAGVNQLLARSSTVSAGWSVPPIEPEFSDYYLSSGAMSSSSGSSGGTPTAFSYQSSHYSPSPSVSYGSSGGRTESTKDTSAPQQSQGFLAKMRRQPVRSVAGFLGVDGWETGRKSIDKVVMHKWANGARCVNCDRWQETVKPRLEANGIQVDVVDDLSSRESAPQVDVVVNGKATRLVGAASYSQIMSLAK